MFKMTSMDCSPVPIEPPKKLLKLESLLDLRQKHKKELTSSPQANIVQRIKYVLPAQHSRHQAKTLHTYYEVTENVTVFNLENGEMLAVNAPLHVIRNWQSAPIPYLCLPVNRHVGQHAVINRTSIMLSSLYQLTNCAIGVKADEDTCKKTGSQLQDLTALRRTIWRFLVSEITYMPPHLRQFMKAELKLILATTLERNPSQSPATNNFKTPGCPTLKVKG